ncbi:anthocyanidin 3-O-glucosyltransferase 5-like [Neltuma alba]|uniref:anthocyanidin 3-O-glucosyltransferase 5-like n=1 Tax=Neltuma alba TaxID=207710 RepID=UPI0010A4C241|nr:anthocyanidin 3-O-glucosyltransferase 5-like [Prosopis alba]
MHHPHVALLSSPGLGHLMPTIHLGKLLALHHGFKVTILAITFQTSEAESRILKSAISSINFCDFLQIPPPDLYGLLENEAAIVERLCVVMQHGHPPSVLIVDIFGSECLSIAEEFRMLKYIFVASNAWFFSLLLYSPILDKQVQGQFVDQKEPFEIPGCSPLRPEDVVDPMLDRNTRQYQEYIGIGIGVRKGDGIFVNTWEELQHKDLESLRDENLLGGMLKVPVYAVGPLVREPEPPSRSTMELLGWLDQQPSDSVVYVSFGSGGTLSHEQTIEVAWGLELSRLRFMWVVRPPNRGRADSAFFSTGDGSL